MTNVIYERIKSFEHNKRQNKYQWKTVGVICAMKWDNITINGMPVITIGISFCNPKDTFDMTKGLQLAKDRAMMQLSSTEPIKVHALADASYSTESMFKRAQKYFKGCVIIYPRYISSHVY